MFYLYAYPLCFFIIQYFAYLPKRLHYHWLQYSLPREQVSFFFKECYKSIKYANMNIDAFYFNKDHWIKVKGNLWIFFIMWHFVQKNSRVAHGNLTHSRRIDMSLLYIFVSKINLEFKKTFILRHIEIKYVSNVKMCFKVFIKIIFFFSEPPNLMHHCFLLTNQI